MLEDLLQTDLLDVGHPGGHMDDVPREGAVPRVPGSSGGKVVRSVRLQQDPVQARLLRDPAGPATPGMPGGPPLSALLTLPQPSYLINQI